MRIYGVSRAIGADLSAAMVIETWPMPISKRDLIDDLRGAHPDLTRKLVSQIVNDILASVSAALRKGDPVRLAGFGSFVVKDRPARTGRSPRTKEPIQIPARKVVRFRAAKALNQSLTSKGKGKKKG